MQKLKFNGKYYASAEHAFQSTHAQKEGQYNLAKQIEEAPHAGIAKKLSRNIKAQSDTEWESIREEVMFQIQIAKAKDTNVRAALMAAKKNFAHPVQDTFWGTGLQPDETMLTDPDQWPGENMLGRILNKVREVIAEDFTTDGSSAANTDDMDDGSAYTPAPTATALHKQCTPSELSTSKQQREHSRGRSRTKRSSPQRTPKQRTESLAGWLRDRSNSIKRKANTPPQAMTDKAPKHGRNPTPPYPSEGIAVEHL